MLNSQRSPCAGTIHLQCVATLLTLLYPSSVECAGVACLSPMQARCVPPLSLPTCETAASAPVERFLGPLDRSHQQVLFMTTPENIFVNCDQSAR